MAFYDYEEKPSSKVTNYRIDQLGKVFTYIFTFEAVAKITAHGFIVSKYSYLRDYWNMLDLLIVITG
jgi:hypothetical protein